MPEGVYGPEFEDPANWERPETPAAELRMFRQVRDRFLLPVLSAMQLKKTHTMLSVDGEVPGRPVEIAWDSHLPSTVSWSDRLGTVGFGMLIDRFWPHGEKKRVGGIQIGGVVLAKQAFIGTPSRWYKDMRYSKTAKNYAVLTHQEWFLTSWGLWLLHRTAAPNVLWHKVKELEFGQAINKAFENAVPA